ncbi:MAG: tpr domain protein [Gammaproteobacteria bacterium]|nr:tpr domain protein [Gammaproteobacteria bacterium]
MYQGRESFTAGFEARDFKEAIHNFNALLKIDPTNGNAHRILGLIYKLTAEYDLAHSHLVRAIFYYNKDAEAYVLLGGIKGSIYFQHSKAIEALDVALKLRPGHYLALQYRGWNKGKLGQHKLAIADLEASLTFGSSLDCEETGNTYLYLGQNKMMLQKYDEAIVDFTKACAYNPNDAQIHSGLGLCNLLQKNYKEAIVDLNTAIKLNSDDPENYQLRGCCKEKLHDHAGALQDYKTRLELNPLGDAVKQAAFRVQRTLSSISVVVQAAGEAAASAPDN